MPPVPSPYPGMGAIPHDGGCTFRVWAPFAEQVWVVGGFTNPPWWPGRVELAKDGPEHWSMFVPHFPAPAPAFDPDDPDPQRQYKLVVRNPFTADPLWKLDPYCRNATGSGGNSVVTDLDFDWADDDFRMPPWNELVIYELHVGTFNDPADQRTGNFDSLVARLDHLRDLGVNAVEVLPAVEFMNEYSMGYNPALLFAIEQAYGEPRVVQRFVREAHRRGLAVIFDVVYNHFGPEDLDACLRRFDGWSQDGGDGVYFYNDGRRHSGFGPRPDYGRAAVRDFIKDNVRMWLRDYRADGLRFDSTVNVRSYDDFGRHDIAWGWWLLQEINAEVDANPFWAHKVTIAEDLQGNDWITRPPVPGGGAGFDSQWDKGFFDAVVGALEPADDAGRDVPAVAAAVERAFNGDPVQRVVYTESHDEVTWHDGREDKRVPRRINFADAESWASLKRSTLGAALALTAPGVPMIFQGQELFEWQTWTDRTPMRWDRKETFRGVFELYRDLIALRRNRHGNTRGLTGPNTHVMHRGETDKVLAFHRWDRGGLGDDVIVVANFANRGYPSYNVGVPRAGTWYVRFNSDARTYGDQLGNFFSYDTTAGPGGNMNMPFNGNVGLGPYTCVILSQ